MRKKNWNENSNIVKLENDNIKLKTIDTVNLVLHEIVIDFIEKYSSHSFDIDSVSLAYDSLQDRQRHNSRINAG